MANTADDRRIALRIAIQPQSLREPMIHAVLNKNPGNLAAHGLVYRSMEPSLWG